MIKFRLICKECDLSFDSWFASSQEYEKLKKGNFLSCHNCNSNKVEKNLMAPKIITKTSLKKTEKKFSKFKEIQKKVKEYQQFIKKNFEYVGENFSYEARSIHYDIKKQDKRIYGTASNDEIKELREEGIEIQNIPWIDDNNNN